MIVLDTSIKRKYKKIIDSTNSAIYYVDYDLKNDAEFLSLTETQKCAMAFFIISFDNKIIKCRGIVEDIFDHYTQQKV